VCVCVCACVCVCVLCTCDNVRMIYTLLIRLFAYTVVLGRKMCLYVCYKFMLCMCVCVRVCVCVCVWLLLTSIHMLIAAQQKAPESKVILQVTILLDELRNEDAQVRLNAMRKVSIIAQTLGPTRTREELVPYLNGM